VNEKSAIKSKTILTNSFVLGLIPILKAFEIEVSQELLLSLIPLANILLRLVTSSKVSS